MSILLSDHARIEGLWVVDRVPQLDGERILSHTRGCQTRWRAARTWAGGFRGAGSARTPLTASLFELRKAEERQSLKDGRRANGWLPVIRLCAMTCEGYEASPSRSLDRRGPGLGAP